MVTGALLLSSELVQRFRNDVAPRLLAKFSNGGVFAVTRTVVPNPDPLRDPTVTEAKVEINAVARGISGQMLASDPNLQATDLLIISASLDYTPVVGGIVEVNGKQRLVIRVDNIVAAGLPAASKFYVR